MVDYFDKQVMKHLPNSNQQYTENGPLYDCIISITGEIFGVIATDETNKAFVKQKWTEILAAWIDVDATGPLNKLLQALPALPTTSNLSWTDPHLDTIATKAVQSILKGDESHKSLVLRLLSSGMSNIH